MIYSDFSLVIDAAWFQIRCIQLLPCSASAPPPAQLDRLILSQQRLAGWVSNLPIRDSKSLLNNTNRQFYYAAEI